MKRVVLVLVLATLVLPESAAELDELVNYREYSDTLSSSGQPTAEQLLRVREAGFERVMYLAFSDHQTSLEHEDRLAVAFAAGEGALVGLAVVHQHGDL